MDGHRRLGGLTAFAFELTRRAEGQPVTIFAALWLTATTLLIKPNAELPERSPGTVGAKLRSLSGRAVSRA